MVSSDSGQRKVSLPQVLFYKMINVWNLKALRWNMAWRTKISLPFTANLSAVKPSRDMNSMSEITVCIPPVYLVLFQCFTKPLGRSATLYYKKNSRFKVKMEKCIVYCQYLLQRFFLADYLSCKYILKGLCLKPLILERPGSNVQMYRISIASNT